ncbi:MAG: hypothetical protein HRU03_03525 [Nanoarchaeales archaeon]|nr:hypothetical protein [Nanoarchaeales archaeon]
MKNKIKFHIHVDAKVISKQLERELIKQKLFKHDFLKNDEPSVYQSFNPVRHYTNRYIELKQIIQKDNNFEGYLEAEYIITNIKIKEKKFDNSIKFPFKIKRRTLSSQRNEKFRETEFHLTMNYDKSNKKLIRKLLESGLYPAYMLKENYTSIIFTIQGNKKEINKLYQQTKKYLEFAGGAVNCSIKKELAIRYLVVKLNPEDMPEIADKVEYH